MIIKLYEDGFTSNIIAEVIRVPEGEEPQAKVYFPQLGWFPANAKIEKIFAPRLETP